MTDNCQFTFTYKFKNYSEVTNLAYFVLHIVLYIYLYVFNNGKKSWSRDDQEISETKLGADGNGVILSAS